MVCIRIRVTNSRSIVVSISLLSQSYTVVLIVSSEDLCGYLCL